MSLKEFLTKYVPPEQQLLITDVETGFKVVDIVKCSDLLRLDATVFLLFEVCTVCVSNKNSLLHIEVA